MSTLKEAIESGKPFRHSSHEWWTDPSRVPNYLKKAVSDEWIIQDEAEPVKKLNIRPLVFGKYYNTERGQVMLGPVNHSWRILLEGEINLGDRVTDPVLGGDYLVIETKKELGLYGLRESVKLRDLETRGW